MLQSYVILYVLACGLMALGCGIPAVILAVVAAGLALREELRWAKEKVRPPRVVAPVPHKG